MGNPPPKIVVLTPIKNEQWILERFLAVTSQFADHIIVADQKSTDRSAEICQNYPKVVLLENPSDKYDEAGRQMLLIQAARELVPGPRILLALDADEILAADALAQSGWQTMLQAKPGTVLCFEKPDLYGTPDHCIRHHTPWPLGYADDGVEHQPKKIHSIRIPTPDGAPRLNINDVKFLHYALTREAAQASKMRLYSVLENALGTTPSPLKRRAVYRSGRDWKKAGKLESSPQSWFDGWNKIGIDTHTIQLQHFYWQDFEVLKQFRKHGERRFWPDDIWDFDWEACRKYAIAQGMADMPSSVIASPPRVQNALRKLQVTLYSSLRGLLR